MDFLNPRQTIIDYLNPQKNMVAADFGCGSGEWAIPLTQMLEDGKVYAIDLLEAPLSALRGKMRHNNLQNLEIVKANVEKTISRLLSNSIDIVLMTNLLFQVEDKKAVLEEAKRVLKPGGRLLIIEWSLKSVVGPENKVNFQHLKDWAKQSSFKVIKEFPAASFHYALLLQKNNQQI